MSDDNGCIRKESGTALENNFEGKTMYFEVQIPICMF